MADYYTQLSCIFDVGTAENADKAIVIKDEVEAETERDEGRDLGFDMERTGDHGEGALWISSDDYGKPEDVIRFVLRCAETLNLSGCWGFTWSLSCSRPRLDAFGGGAHILDLGKRETVTWVDCSNWVIENTPDSPAATTVEVAP